MLVRNCRWLCPTAVAALLTVACPAFLNAADVAVSLENDFLRYDIGSDGRNLHFIDKKTGSDYAQPSPGAPIASVTIGKQEHVATTASRDGDRIKLTFGNAGVTATLKITAHKHHLVVEVIALEGQGVDTFTFLDLPLTLKGVPGEPFAACALALNLKTNVAEIPQPVSRPRATCHSRFGFAGAAVGLIACPSGELRNVMKEAVAAAPELPHSNVGGPWALDSPANKGSYLFNFGDMSESTVDSWIQLARDLGINQIDFHGGGSFRFGDCRPNPKTYPKGYASLKAVIDKLHTAGIKAGLHTYAFFMAKECPWVTPVPDKRLAKSATFTLAGDIAADAVMVPVVESTQNESATTGFFVRNSATIQIDDELITFTDAAKSPPYGYTGCKRGVLGTTATPHATGAKVHHLKECFGLFVPDGDSTLYTEVAAKTAEAYNECGFDMIYLDALDGEDIVGGWQNAWHYGSKFAFEICKRLKKPAIMEMSTFHHHLWYVRSRMGAWDHPTRSHKKFIDIHCEANRGLLRQFLPGHLGWWAVKTWTGPQGDPTFADDIEYLCCKCIGTDVGFSIMGVSPGSLRPGSVYQRLAGIMRQYEELRHANYFSPTVKARLAEAGKEYTLERDDEGKWRFRQAIYAKHKVDGINGGPNIWTTGNPFGPQPLRIRIETLMGAGPYDAPDNPTLIDFADSKALPERAAAGGVSLDVATTTEQVKAGKCSGVLTVSNAGKVAPRGSWAKAGKIFNPPTDLTGHQGLGLWVHGDGQGEVLNLQLTGSPHISHGIADHYVTVDFTGWRYVELIEPEGERHAQFEWPYGNIYSIYREHVNYHSVQTLSLWCNNVPANGKVSCLLSPVRAIPLKAITLKNPAIEIDGKRIVFPITMESGHYLEFNSLTDWTHSGPEGNQVGDVKPQGDVPMMKSGANRLTFGGEVPDGSSARARVTVACYGDRM